MMVMIRSMGVSTRSVCISLVMISLTDMFLSLLTSCPLTIFTPSRINFVSYMEKPWKKRTTMTLGMQATMSGRITLYVYVNSKIVRMAVMGASVVPPTTAPIPTRA